MAVSIGIAPWASDDPATPGSLEALLRQAERAEALGFHSVWFPESHFLARGAVPAPLLLLAAIAARTRRIRLGTSSYLLPIRNPIQVAEEVAVLDRLSGGRVVLGVGRGFRPALFEAYDVPAREKLARFENALEVMLRAWRGEPIARVGEGEAATPVRLAPRPVQEPHPPIWVAAFGPRALRSAGRLGLPYLASPVEPLERLEENYARHREARGDDGPLDVPVLRTVFVTRDGGLRSRVRDALTQQARALRDARASGLRSAADASVDDWALVGEPRAVEDGIERYRERIGLTHLLVRAQVPGASDAEVSASVEALAELAR